MSLLTHQSFANSTTPYWASTSEPTTMTSPLTVSSKPGDAKMIISAANPIGGVYLTDGSGGNPVGITCTQAPLQPNNSIQMNVGNVAPVLIAAGTQVRIAQPIVLATASNAQALTVSQNAGASVLTQGSGGTISLSNTPVVTINGTTSFGAAGQVLATNGNNAVAMSPSNLAVQMSNNTGGVADVGLTGTSAFLGTGPLPILSPGVLVDSNNSSILRFVDATSNAQTISNNPVTHNIDIGTAISVSSNGTATIGKMYVASGTPAITSSGSNLVVQTPGFFNSIVCDPSGNVSIPNLALSSSISVSNINTTTINSNTSASLVQIYSNPTAFVDTTGAGGAWQLLYDISVNATQVAQPSLDYITPLFNVNANNGNGNDLWGCQFGIVGNNVGSPPANYKSHAAIGLVASGAIPCSTFVDTYCLRRGIDYTSNTTSLRCYVKGTVNNPYIQIYSGSNIYVRAYPF